VPNYTPRYQFPSPTPAEAPDGPDGIKDLAVALENKIASMLVAATGSGSFVFNNTPAANAAVTFPVGRFATPPSLFAIIAANVTLYAVTSPASISTSGCTLFATTIAKTNATGTIGFSWIALLAP
jgi:hypothetical protein